MLQFFHWSTVSNPLCVRMLCVTRPRLTAFLQTSEVNVTEWTLSFFFLACLWVRGIVGPISLLWLFLNSKPLPLCKARWPFLPRWPHTDGCAWSVLPCGGSVVEVILRMLNAIKKARTQCKSKPVLQYRGCSSLQLLCPQALELTSPTHQTVRLHHSFQVPSENTLNCHDPCNWTSCTCFYCDDLNGPLYILLFIFMLGDLGCPEKNHPIKWIIIFTNLDTPVKIVTEWEIHILSFEFCVPYFVPCSPCRL